MLESLPKDLDETYDRMLLSIDDHYFEEAFAALQWLSFSNRPLFLEKIAEACAIKLNENPAVDEENKFPPSEVLNILPGLVTEFVKAGHEYISSGADNDDPTSPSSDLESEYGSVFVPESSEEMVNSTLDNLLSPHPFQPSYETTEAGTLLRQGIPTIGQNS